MLNKELIEDFVKQLASYKVGVLGVANYDAANAFAAGVGMENIVYTHELKVRRKCQGGDGVPCSPTCCRCPGLVRSATILLNAVMNSP